MEYEPTPLPYGATLTELLNYSAGTFQPKPRSVLEIYLSAGEDILPIQERYAWFLEELFRDSVSEKKKGQRKKPLAEQICAHFLEPYVSGVSLGKDKEVDAPQVNVQYAVIEREDRTHELV